MMSRSLLAGLGVCLLTGAAGCTTMSSSVDRPLARSETASRRTTSLLDRLTDEPDETAEPERGREVEQQSPLHLAGPASAAPTPPAAARSLDSETLTLIEMELRDLPDDQRRRWMEYLTSIDPDSIPYVLQSRRLQASQPTIGADREAVPPRDAEFDAGHEYERPAAVAANGSMSSMNASTAHVAPSSFRSEHSSRPPDGQFGRGGDSRLHAPDPLDNGSGGNGISPFDVHPRRDARLAYQESPASPESSGYSARSSSYELPSISPGDSAAVEPPRGRAASRIEYDLPPTDGPGQPSSLPNTPLSAGPQGAYWQEELERLTALIEAEVGAAQPGMTDQERLAYVKHHVWLRMLHLMAEQPQLAQQAIPGIDPSEQEFWTELFWAISNYFDARHLPDPADRAALTVAQLDAAKRRLQRQAPLELLNTSFCYKINSFGNYERYERDEFRPGQPVLLYAELRNFRSEPTNAGSYTTRLRSRIELRRGGADGEVVDENTFPATEDLCRSVRNDYFHSYKIDLPQHLSPGPHTLVLIVEDELSGKTATETIGLLIR